MLNIPYCVKIIRTKWKEKKRLKGLKRRREENVWFRVYGRRKKRRVKGLKRMR